MLSWENNFDILRTKQSKKTPNILIDNENKCWLQSYILYFVFGPLKQKYRNNRKNVEEYFSVVLGGRWFVFLVEPCAAGKDVRLLVWKRLVSSFYVRLAGRANKCTEGGG